MKVDSDKAALARAIIELKKAMEEIGGSEFQLDTEEELQEIIERNDA